MRKAPMKLKKASPTKMKKGPMKMKKASAMKLKQGGKKLQVAKAPRRKTGPLREPQKPFQGLEKRAPMKKSSALKMKKASAMKKPLTPKQKKLPIALQKAILAAPTKMLKASAMKMMPKSAMKLVKKKDATKDHNRAARKTEGTRLRQALRRKLGKNKPSAMKMKEKVVKNDKLKPRKALSYVTLDKSTGKVRPATASETRVIKMKLERNKNLLGRKKGSRKI